MTPKHNGKNNKQSASSKPTGKQLSFTQPTMDRDQIIQSGEDAAQLLNSPIYNLAVNSVVEDLGAEMLRSEPHEHNRREWLYNQGSALGRVNQKLVEFVQMAQSLELGAISEEEGAQREQDSLRGFATVPTE